MVLPPTLARCLGSSGRTARLRTSHLALVKLGLSAAMLGFAAANRFRFTPALAQRADGASGKAARRMRLSVALEAGLGLAVVSLAAVLAGTPPGAHIHIR